MTHACSWKLVFALCFLCPSGLVVAQQDSDQQPQFSTADLEDMSLAELRQEQRRLADRLFQQRSSGDGSVSKKQLARARLMGEIVRMQQLVRLLNAEHVTEPSSKNGAVPTLTADPARITVRQRQTKSVTAFSTGGRANRGAVRIKIGDITGGQVLLEVLHADVLKPPIVDTISVQQGDVVPFILGDAKYFLLVVELKNFLLGDDFGVFEISTKRPDETAEIQQLLKAIESSDLVFVRNGQEATAAEAAEFLRAKWRMTEPRVTTAHGFINRVASHSSASGQPYKVKLDDEETLELKYWLSQRVFEPRGERQGSVRKGD